MSATEIAEQLALEFGRDGSREALRRYDEKLRTLGRMAAGPYMVAAIKLCRP